MSLIGPPNASNHLHKRASTRATQPKLCTDASYYGYSDAFKGSSYLCLLF